MSILWFSNETPSRDGQGGQRRQFFQIEALLEDGHEVQVISLAGDQEDSSLRELAPVHRANFWWKGRPVAVRGMVSTAQLVRSRRWGGVVVAHSESWPVGKRLAALARAPVFVDLHNVHSAWYREAGDFEAAAAYQELERDLIRTAQVVSVCTPRDVEKLHAVPGAEGAEIVVMGHGIDPLEWATPPSAPSVPIKMFGNWDWGPNEAGLRWFLHDVWPLLRQADHDLTCEIAGNPGGFHDLPDGVRMVGRVPSVGAFLSSAAVVGVPVQGGVGAPVKYAEALASGVPVVATTEAAHGLAVRGPLVSDDPEEWAKWVTDVVRAPLAPRAAATRTRAMVLSEVTWYAQTEPLRNWARSVDDR